MPLLRLLSATTLLTAACAANFDREIVSLWQRELEAGAGDPEQEGPSLRPTAGTSNWDTWRAYEAWRELQPSSDLEDPQNLSEWESWKNEQATLIVNGTKRTKDKKPNATDVENALKAAAMMYRSRLRRGDVAMTMGLGDEPWIKQLMPTADHMCSMSELDEWKSRRDAQRLFTIWNDHVGDQGFVFSHQRLADGICVVQGLTTSSDVDLPETPSHASKVLSLTWKTRAPICDTEGDRFQYIRPEIFTVSGPLANHGKERLLATIWPTDNKCRSSTPCPVVVFFSGIGEHSRDMEHVGYNEEKLKQGFENLHQWALLRYLEHDKDCYETLGSVLLMPELNGHETWVTHGRDLMTYFIIPVLDSLKHDSAGAVDMDRVSVVGYSEGAFGAMQAAVQYPDYFTIAVAASLSAPRSWWDSVPMHNKTKASTRRLRSVILAWGEFDSEGDQPTNLEKSLTWLSNAGVLEDTTVLTQFHAGIGHQDLWEHVFNQWAAFHEVIWKGNYKHNVAFMRGLSH